MPCSGLRRWIPLFAALALAGCSRSGTRVSEKIAILPFENLASDPGLDWMSRGFSDALRLQLTGSRNAEPVSVASLRDAPGVGASRILQGYFSVRQGRLEVQAVLEDAASVRTLRALGASGPAAAGLVPLADALARQLDPQARPPATSSAAALQNLVQAQQSPNAEAAEPAFQRATAADPNFGAAWLGWAQFRAARGEREPAQQVIASARTRTLPAIERAQLEVVAAALSGNADLQRRSLLDLARLAPAQSDVFRALGDIDLRRHSYRTAAEWYGKALARDPDNPTLLNQYGYALAYGRDLEGAARSLSRYRDLRPAEANPLDSLGDVHLHLGRLQEAEKHYQEAYAKDRGFLEGGDLYKIAWARLLRGEVKGADAAWGEFVSLRRANRDPLATWRQAQWEYLTGRRAQAMATLAAWAGQPGGPPVLRSLALGQKALWSLERGDAAQAAQYASQAQPLNAVALTARFLTQPPAPAAEWERRAAQAFGEPAQASLKDHALAFALLLSKQFPAAAAVLKRLYQRTPPAAAEGIQVLYAWALLETGDVEQAARLASVNPVPDSTTEQPFLSLWFPRLFQLRAQIADRQGRKEQALENRQMLMAVGGL